MKSSSGIGANVVSIEIEGLSAVADLLADGTSEFAQAFDAAVALCDAVKGRLIVTGMGKSGHIARKIAATFASTGTPSQFVHPAEASHGDLGMIAADDLVIALSRSGETAELRDIIAHAGRFDVKVIAVTSDANSALARAGEVALTLPAAAEACSAAPAPTTSTTMMLALGDALAVAVLRAKGFSARDFHSFHPGGKLGAALRRAVDLMHHKHMPLCAPDDPMTKAIDVISEGGFGCAGVIDGAGALIGMVTDGDLRRHYGRIASGARVSEVMTAAPHVVAEDSLAGEVLALFADRKITAVFIVGEGRKPVGLVHVHDCLSTGVL